MFDTSFQHLLSGIKKEKREATNNPKIVLLLLTLQINDFKMHYIYATHTIYNKSTPVVQSVLQILVSNLRGANLLSWITLGKQAQILLQHFKQGFYSPGTQGSLFLWPRVHSQSFVYIQKPQGKPIQITLWSIE